MKTEVARKILQALIQGNDPQSGQALPEGGGSVLQRADVMRALLAGVGALIEQEARAEKRSLKPQNMGRRWADEEHAQLVSAFNAGEPLSDVAARHSRTLRGIEARLECFGLLKAEQRVTRDR